MLKGKFAATMSIQQLSLLADIEPATYLPNE